MFFTYHEDLGSTPARVNRFTGEIQINQRYFRNMPDAYKRFIIEHEKAHFMKNTRSEFEADRYAFEALAGKSPRSLKDSVHSISRVLTFRNPEHVERLRELLILALEWDLKHGNQKAAEALNQLKNSNLSTPLNHPYMFTNNSYLNNAYPPSDHEELYDNGAGKARREAKRKAKDEKKAEKDRLKQEKAQLKNDRIAAKNEVKLSRADKNRAKGEAKKTLAEQGKSGTDWIGGAVDGVLGLFGKKKASDASVETSGEGSPAASDNSGDSPKFLGMPKAVGIGVVVVVVLSVIGVIIWLIIRKKKA